MFQQVKINSATKTVNRSFTQHRPKTTAQVNKAGIILDLDIFQSTFLLKDFLTRLKIKATCSSIILFSEEKEKLTSFKEHAFYKKDLQWKGGFKKGSVAEKFQQEEYDLLINYFCQPLPELKILSVTVKANLKVGFPTEENRLNDLEVVVDPEAVELFSKEINKYLNIINKK